MRLAFLICGLAVGILVVAILAFQPRPPAVVNQPVAANSATVVLADEKNVIAPPAVEIHSHSVTAPETIQPEKSDVQKLADAIRTALQSGDDSAWNRISQNELAALIKLDPQTAAEIALSLAPSFAREQMLRQIAHGWADQNSAAALTWASTLSAADDRISSLTDVSLQMSQTDPAAAIAAATRYELTQQPGLIQSLMQSWAAKDPAAALDWADRLPAGDQRNQAMTRLAFVVAQTSPQDAANLVSYEIPAGADQEEAALSVLDQWALQDFARADAWAGQFSESLFRKRAEQELNAISQKLQTAEN